jgi:integrase/recombinase XerD
MKDEYIKELVTPTIFEEKNLTKGFENVKKEQLKYLSRDEIHKVLDQVTGSKEKLLFLFMWYTGCRVTEVIGVRKRDIDFKNKEITIRWLKNRKYLYRTMPIHSQIKQLLELSTTAIGLDTLVFPYSRQRVWQIFKKHQFGKFNWIHPHTFRHSFAVNYLRQADSANDLVILRKLMGHSSILTTMKYLDIVPRDQAKQLAKIEF